MKIRWDSPFTHYTWGARCDRCGKEEDPEGYNMHPWYQVCSNYGNWDFCGEDCLRAHMDREGLRKVAPEPDEEYLGGCGVNPKCYKHEQQVRMLPRIGSAPDGWTVFECDCGNFTYIQTTGPVEAVVKYSRRR